jgi:hypothetical protein
LLQSFDPSHIVGEDYRYFSSSHSHVVASTGDSCEQSDDETAAVAGEVVIEMEVETWAYKKASCYPEADQTMKNNLSPDKSLPNYRWHAVVDDAEDADRSRAVNIVMERHVERDYILDHVDENSAALKLPRC